MVPKPILCFEIVKVVNYSLLILRLDKPDGIRSEAFPRVGSRIKMAKVVVFAARYDVHARQESDEGR